MTEKQSTQIFQLLSKFFSRYSTPLTLMNKKSPFFIGKKTTQISCNKISSVPPRSAIISQVWPGGAGERVVEGEDTDVTGSTGKWDFFS